MQREREREKREGEEKKNKKNNSSFYETGETLDPGGRSDKGRTRKGKMKNWIMKKKTIRYGPPPMARGREKKI